MSKNLHDELSVRTPVWIDIADIKRRARAERSAYIAATAPRVWSRLSDAVKNALGAESESGQTV